LEADAASVCGEVQQQYAVWKKQLHLYGGRKSGLGDKCSDPTEAASVVGMVVRRTHQKNEERQ